MILAINTASEKNSIALFWPDKISKQVNWTSYRTQSQELLPKIDRLLRTSEVKSSELKAIAVYQGPGSYTGLRVAISVANAMAWGLDIPVIGIKNGQMAKLPNGQRQYNNLTIQQFNPSTSLRAGNLNALEIAKQAEKIIKRKKLRQFSKIVIPYYGSPLK